MGIQLGAMEAWTKSSHSGVNGNCVEVASPAVSAIVVRDSKDPDGPILSFRPEAWAAFVTDIGRGAFGVS